MKALTEKTNDLHNVSSNTSASATNSAAISAAASTASTASAATDASKESHNKTQNEYNKGDNNSENSEKLTLTKIRCLSLHSLFKSELDDFDRSSVSVVNSWFNVEAKVLKEHLNSYGVPIHLEWCQTDTRSWINALQQIFSELYLEIDSSRSVEDLYDFLYRSYLEIKTFREEILTEHKTKFSFFIPNPKILEDALKDVPFYVYCDKTLKFYREMLDLIAPIMERKQISYWQYVDIIFNPRSERIKGAELVPIITVRLSEVSLLFAITAGELNNLAERAKLEHSDFLSLANNTIEKALKIFESQNKLGEERKQLVLKTSRQGKYIPQKDTRDTFYRMRDNIDALETIKREFELEYKIIKEKLNLEQQKKGQLEKEKKIIAERKLSLENAKSALKTKEAEETKKAKEAFEAFEKEQRKKYEEYKAALIDERNQKITKRKVFKSNFESGIRPNRKLINTVIGALKKCELEDFLVLEGILNHTLVLETAIQKTLPKLGFVKEAVASQGFNYKLGPFSATHHNSHASSSNAGVLHPDFVSKLRRIFWAMGIDKELIQTLQYRKQNTPQKSNGNTHGNNNGSAKGSANGKFGVLHSYDSKTKDNISKAKNKVGNTASASTANTASAVSAATSNASSAANAANTNANSASAANNLGSASTNQFEAPKKKKKKKRK